MDDKLKREIIAVAQTGKSNMFNLPVVQRIAFEMNFYELVMFIEEHRDEYVRFILHGDS